MDLFYSFQYHGSLRVYLGNKKILVKLHEMFGRMFITLYLKQGRKSTRKCLHINIASIRIVKEYTGSDTIINRIEHITGLYPLPRFTDTLHYLLGSENLKW